MPTKTVTNIVDETVNYLGGRTADELTTIADSNTLGSSEGDTVFNVDFVPPNLKVGSLIGINLELLLVIKVLNKTITVIRAMHGSSIGEGLADTIVYVKPRFSRFVIFNEIEPEIRSWPDDVFHVNATTVAGVNGFGSFNQQKGFAVDGVVADRFIDFLEVREQRENGRWDRMNGWRAARRLDAAVGTDGVILMFSRLPERGTVRVIWKEKFLFDGFDADTDLGDNMGIPESAFDIIKYGVAWRLMTGSAKQNVLTCLRRGKRRRATEVREGSTFQTGGAFLALRDRRLREEADRLRREFPVARN